MPSSIKPIATLILAVYNGHHTIVACLDTLLTQTVPIELIIVDDGSTDDTITLINQVVDLNVTNPKAIIKLLHQAHLGPAKARNLGAQSATSDILLFVDADMTFDQDYVKDLIAPITSGHAIGTYTSEERVANWENIWARCWNIQEGWENGKRFPTNPSEFGTDFRAIKTQEFAKVAGFDDIGYTDTWSLFAKLGVRPLRVNAICYHKNPSSLRQVYLQAKWSAKRPYRLGSFGTLVAFFRTSPILSVLIATVKAVRHANLVFFVFKLVYDWGRFTGIFEFVLTGKTAK